MANAGVATALRFQPIFPGHEEAGLTLVRNAHEAGVRHISAEYLKLPIESSHKASAKRINEALGCNGGALYRAAAARRVGREFVLPVSYKLPRLLELRRAVRTAGISFGFGDNELIPYSDGMSCCSGTDLYLRNYRLFDANCSHLISSKRSSEPLSFSGFADAWIPRYPLTPHLNSNVAIKNPTGESDWLQYLRRDWNGDAGLYGPKFFYGVNDTGTCDAEGNKIYARSNELDFLAMPNRVRAA